MEHPDLPSALKLPPQEPLRVDTLFGERNAKISVTLNTKQDAR